MHDLAQGPFGHLVAQRYVPGRDGVRGAHEYRTSGVRARQRVDRAFDRFCRHRLNQEHGGVWRERLGRMRNRPDGVAHVVQAIEEGDEAVVRAREILGAGHLEANAISDACFLGRAPGRFDGWRVGIEAVETRVGEGQGHQHGRCPIAAPHIRHLRSCLQARLYPIEGGNPALHEVSCIAGPEGAVDCRVQFGCLITPRQPVSRSEGLCNALLCFEPGLDGVKEAPNIGRAAGVYQRYRVLGGSV